MCVVVAVQDRVCTLEPSKQRLFELYVSAMQRHALRSASSPTSSTRAPVMRLDLSNCHIGDDGVEFLVSSLLSALQGDGGDVPLTLDAPAQPLLSSSRQSAVSQRAPYKVQLLDLRGNGITDSGVQALMRCVIPYQVAAMDVRMNHVTGAGIDAVAEYFRGIDGIAHVIVDESGRVEALGSAGAGFDDAK